MFKKFSFYQTWYIYIYFFFLMIRVSSSPLYFCLLPEKKEKKILINFCNKNKNFKCLVLYYIAKRNLDFYCIYKMSVIVLLSWLFIFLTERISLFTFQTLCFFFSSSFFIYFYYFLIIFFDFCFNVFSFVSSIFSIFSM